MKFSTLLACLFIAGCANILPTAEKPKVEYQPEKIYVTVSDVEYKYLYTLLGKALLNPPLLDLTAVPDGHTTYKSPMDPYVADLIDYRIYLTKHLIEIARVDSDLDADLKDKVSCMSYVDYMKDVPSAPEKINLHVTGSKSAEALQLVLSRYVYTQRAYIDKLKSILSDIDKTRRKCLL